MNINISSLFFSLIGFFCGILLLFSDLTDIPNMNEARMAMATVFIVVNFPIIIINLVILFNKN